VTLSPFEGLTQQASGFAGGLMTPPFFLQNVLNVLPQREREINQRTDFFMWFPVQSPSPLATARRQSVPLVKNSKTEGRYSST